MKKIAMIAAVVLTCGAAQAQTNASPIYAEIGYLMLDTDTQTESFGLGAVRGLVGYELHPNVAVEATYAVGVAEDTLGPHRLRLKLKSSYGLYIKPKLNVTDRLELFARVGYAESKFELSSRDGRSGTDSDGDVSFGIGLKFDFTKQLYGAIDYMRYCDKNDIQANGITLGIGYRF